MIRSARCFQACLTGAAVAALVWAGGPARAEEKGALPSATPAVSKPAPRAEAQLKNPLGRQPAESLAGAGGVVVDPTILRGPPRLEIVNVAMPRVTARPNAPFDLPVSVSVRNAGDASTRFSLTAEFPSRLDGSSAGPFELGPRETKRTPFRIHTRIGNLRFQGDELPIVIRLVGPSGRELDRHRTRVPFLSEPEVTEREISEALREQKNKTVERVKQMMMNSYSTSHRGTAASSSGSTQSGP